MNRSALSSERSPEVSSLWWLILLLGIASTAAGAILVARPSDSLKTLAVVTGIFLLLDGIAELIGSIGERENRTIRVIAGVVAVIVGIALIRHPFHGVNAIGLLIGIWLVAGGCIRLVHALADGVRPLLGLLIAVLEIVVGVVVVSDPHIGYTALALIVGIWLILNGVGTMLFAIAIRHA